MNILIIDRDALVCNLMSNRLEQMGHKTLCEENKNIAIKKIKDSNFGCIFIDPSPLNNVKTIVFDILRILDGRIRPYIVLLSKEATIDNALSGFCNNLLKKPLDSSALVEVVDNAKIFHHYCHILSTDSEKDRPKTVLGIIDKNSFGQLFLSSIDRGFRYLEKNFVLFIDILNLSDITKNIEEEKANSILKDFAENLSLVRRQSDVIGRVCVNSFGILLQRPIYENEIEDAFSRFQENLLKIIGNIKNKYSLSTKIEIKISMIELPACRSVFCNII